MEIKVIAEPSKTLDDSLLMSFGHKWIPPTHPAWAALKRKLAQICASNRGKHKVEYYACCNTIVIRGRQSHWGLGDSILQWSADDVFSINCFILHLCMKGYGKDVNINLPIIGLECSHLYDLKS